jgi:DNA-binding transcriptional LysR family regulator
MPALNSAMDWDDVRVFLAVARKGSMRAAGRTLGLSQPTIARRLAAFEASFGGSSLFDRLPEGLRLNAAGEQLIPAAQSVEDAVLTLERRRAAASPALSGTVRVSTGECAAGFLARCLSGPATTRLPPGITLELVESRQTANLARREADMALRHQPPESGDYYVSKAGTFGAAVYRRRGTDADAWITYTEEQAHYPPARWVQQRAQETGVPVALRASSMLMHLEAIRAGTGRGVLPCYVGDGHPLLERLSPPIAEIAAEYWIIVHRDLRRAACVRAVIDWVKALFAEQRDVLAGGGTSVTLPP